MHAEVKSAASSKRFQGVKSRFHLGMDALTLQKAAYAFAALHFVGLAAYVLNYHFDIPFFEHFKIVDMLQAVQQDTYRPYNADQLYGGHWYLGGTNISVALAYITHWDLTAEALALVALIGATYAIWAGMVGKLAAENTVKYVLLVLGALTLFSLNQAPNLLWLWQLSVYVHNVGVMLCVATLALTRYRLAHMSVAMLGALLAVYDLATGLALIPAYAAGLMFHSSARRYLPLWLIFGALVAWHNYTAFTEYVQVESGTRLGMELSLEKLLFLAGFTVRYLAAPLARNMTDIAPWLGALGIAWCLWVTVRVVRGDALAKPALLSATALMFFVLGAAIITGVGRQDHGLDQAYNGRYIAIGNLFWLGFWLSVLSLHAYRVRGWLTGCIAIYAVLLVSVGSGQAQKEIRRADQFNALAADIQSSWPAPDAELSARLAILGGHDQPITDYINRMYEQRLGLFGSRE